MDSLRPLGESEHKPINQGEDSSAKLASFFSPELDLDTASTEPKELGSNAPKEEELSSSQVVDRAKKLFKDFSSLEEPTLFLTEESLTDAIKREAGDSKTSQLLIATQLKDLVSQNIQWRRQNAPRVARGQIATYSRETQNIQKFFNTIEKVLKKFGSR